MSLRATLWALDDVRTGDPITKLVLLALADEADDDGGSCYPSLRRIAYRAECSVATARRHVAKLESAGLIAVFRPAKQGRGHHNRYQLCLPERVAQGNPSGAQKGSERNPLGVTNPQTRLSNPTKRPAAQRPVGAPYEPWQPAVVEDAVPGGVARQALLELRERMRSET